MSAAEPIDSPLGRSRAGSFARVALAYVVAAFVGLAALDLPQPGTDPFVRLVVGDLAATFAVFAFSFALRNSSVYDAYWSVAPPLFCLALTALAVPPDAFDHRMMAFLAIVCAWALRLTWNWARGWQGLDHEDFRYRDLQRKTGRAYWLVSLLGLHLFPTLLVLAGLVPAFAVFHAWTPRFGLIDSLATVVGALAILLEARADRELRDFVRTRLDRDAVCDGGVWAWSRHPNYVGEVGFWLALGLFGHAASGALYPFVGAGAMAALFLFASIPMMEARQARKPGWAAYARRTSRFLPWPPRA